MEGMPEGMIDIARDIASVLQSFETQAMGDLMDASAGAHKLGAGMGDGMAAVGLMWHTVAGALGWTEREREYLISLLAAIYTRNLTAAGMGPEDLDS